MSDVLREEEISLERVEGIFKSAYMEVSRDSDGDLCVTEGGVRAFVKVDEERKLITLFSLWGMREEAPEADKLSFLNSLNDGLILVRFCMPRPTTLWCDYQMMYSGGLLPYGLVMVTKRFLNIVKGAVMKDDNNLIA